MSECGLVVAGANDEKVRVGATAQGVRAGNGDAQAGETGLPAEVAHESNKSLDLLLSGRGRQHNRGFAQVGEAREGNPAFEKSSRLGNGRPVRIAAQIEIGVAQDGALHVDGRRVLAVLLLE